MKNITLIPSEKAFFDCANREPNLTTEEAGLLLAPVGRYWQRVLNEQPDIDLFHSDGEHAGPYGDFLAAAAFCKLIYGAVSEEICGMGHDFLGGLPLDFSSPTVLEDDRVKTTLDEEKCRHILNIIAD